MGIGEGTVGGGDRVIEEGEEVTGEKREIRGGYEMREEIVCVCMCRRCCVREKQKSMLVTQGIADQIIKRYIYRKKIHLTPTSNALKQIFIVRETVSNRFLQNMLRNRSLTRLLKH